MQNVGGGVGAGSEPYTFTWGSCPEIQEVLSYLPSSLHKFLSREGWIPTTYLGPPLLSTTLFLKPSILNKNSGTCLARKELGVGEGLWGMNEQICCISRALQATKTGTTPTCLGPHPKDQLLRRHRRSSLLHHFNPELRLRELVHLASPDTHQTYSWCLITVKSVKQGKHILAKFPWIG